MHFSSAVWIRIIALLFLQILSNSSITGDGNRSCNTFDQWPTPILCSILPKLQWKTFILLADDATERANRHVVSQSVKKGIHARLTIVNLETEQTFLEISDLQMFVNIIIACKASTMKGILQFASEKNFVSLYFHWLLLLPEDDETDWKKFLNSLNIARPQNLVVISSSAKDEYSIYKSDGINMVPDIRWHKIKSWQKQGHIGSLCVPLYQQHLEGSIMTLAVIEDPPYTMVQETSDGLVISGMDAEALQMVARKLKIRYRILRLADNNYGVLVNNTWTGMMGPFSRNEIDLALPTLTPSLLRGHILGISYPVSGAISQFVIRRPGTNFDYNTYILPFSTSVWTTFLVAYALTFVSSMAAVLSSTYISGNQSKQLDTSEAFFSIFFAATLQDVIRIPKEASLRIILVNFMVLSMLIVSVYSSALVAFLTVERNELPFSTLQGLVDNQEYRVGRLDSVAFQEMLAPKHNDPHDIFLQLQKKMQKYKSNFVSSNSEGIEKVYAENYVYFSYKDGITFAIGQNCSFIVTGLGIQFGRRDYGFPVVKGSPYLEPISKAMIWLKETGLLHYIQLKYLKPSDSFCNIKESSHKTLTIVHVIPIFCMLVFGMVVAIFVLILEIIWYHSTKH